jgi:peptidoglycan/xylan/chitin deacetylase (PgdA/CDA1 family)
VSLTFDDGPDESWTPQVLDALGRRGARATFFMVGERVQRAPGTVRTVIDAGHDIQLHCHRHVRHSELDEPDIERDTSEALAALARVGVRPRWWRTPWGVSTPASERVARRHRLSIVRWTVDTHDWRGDPADAMLARARRELAAGGVVLMHDALGPGALREGCANTVALVGGLIEHAHRELMRIEPVCS